MKKMILFGLLLCILSISGCSWLAVNLTPQPVVDGVAKGGAIARIALTDPPSTPEDLKAYLEENAKMWLELERWYGLRE